MKICSVVLLPALYAACDNGIQFLIFSCILLIIQIARIFLHMDNSMIGLRFAGGPCGFPCLGSGTSTPYITSSSILPVFAISLKMSVTCWYAILGLYLIIYALMLSIPVLLLFFNLLTDFLISNSMNGLFISVGSISFISSSPLLWSTSLK